jgi:hypothetical protein
MATKNADSHSKVYERRQAARLLGWCAAGNFDLIVDWHTTPYPGTESAVLSISSDRNRLSAVAGFLQFNHIIFGEYGVHEQMPHVLGVDIYDGNDQQQTIKEWRYRLKELTDYPTLDDLITDYSPNFKQKPIQYWQYGNAVMVPQHAVPEYCEDNPFEGRNFEQLSELDKHDLDLINHPRFPGIYAINFGKSNLEKNRCLGEFLYRVYPFDKDFNETYAENAALAQPPTWGLVEAAA